MAIISVGVVVDLLVSKIEKSFNIDLISILLICGTGKLDEQVVVLFDIDKIFVGGNFC